MRPWPRRGLAAACGLALSAGAAPLSFPWLVFLAVPVLGWALTGARTPREGFGLGWWAGTAYFAASMSWIVEPFFVEPERHGWMAPFALVFLAGGLALFWGVGFAAACRFGGRARVLAMVLAWVLVEFVRAHIFTGFPWGLIAYGWSETPIFQGLAWLGPHGLGLATLLVAVLPLLLPRVWLGGVLVVALAVAGGLGGAARMGPVDQTGVVVRLVQPNAPQHLKWEPEMVPVFWDRLITYTEAANAPDVVVWPETSLPFLWGEADAAARRMVIAARGADLIVGHRRFMELAVRNSLLHLDGTGAEVADYDKHHLVPFGEYIPLGELAARFGIFGLAANDGVGFEAGPGPRVIAAGDAPPYLPLICYEAIFPGLAQVEGERPAWLLHLTNDAWFGDFAGPYQHLVQARARAIEQGLPLARAANTGISAMIDPYGRIVASAALNTEGYVDAVLPAAIAPPPYTRWGEAPWLVLSFGMYLGLWLRRRRDRAQK